MKNAIAVCSRGMVGLVTSDGPVDVKYPDGNTGQAWIGIQLGCDEYGPLNGLTGKPWSCREPKIIGMLQDVVKSLGMWEVIARHYGGRASGKGK